jgi:exoribonuclease R
VPRRHLKLESSAGEELRRSFAAARNELHIPVDFPPAVLAEADQTAAAPALPDEDRTDLPLVTIDPPGAMDLDQAMHLSRRGTGYRVHYAIADVAAFVTPGGAIDAEAQIRGETLYSPDLRTPLHPPVLSEGAASLLPGQTRPALLWTLDLDSTGEPVSTDVRRALVRSQQRLDYLGVQDALDSGKASEVLILLAEVGRLREERERDRGGISLPIPEQEITADGEGYSLRFRPPLPIDGWNAQISLLTGMAAAELMLYGEVGVLRTLPAAPPEATRRLRRIAAALGVSWPAHQSPAEMIRTLDPTTPQHAALIQESTALLRGAGYTAFDGGLPEDATHAAVAAEYTHVTAPLRRLVDRYSGEVCIALCADRPVPQWVRSALPKLPAIMARAHRLDSALERACVDRMEAAVLRGRVGEDFDAVVIDVADHGADGGIVQLRDPAVRARCAGRLSLGERVRVVLVAADAQAGTTAFRVTR